MTNRPAEPRRPQHPGKRGGLNQRDGCIVQVETNERREKLPAERRSELGRARLSSSRGSCRPALHAPARLSTLSRLHPTTLQPQARIKASMSSAADCATGPSRKRARGSQHSESQEEQSQADDAAQPPASRLYRHALESIFGFLSLEDLSKVLAVSSSWSSAVGSMRSINARVRSLSASHPLFELCASRLAPHIGTLGLACAGISLSQGNLYLLGLRLSGLRSLYYKLPLPLKGKLIFPPSLTLLDVRGFDVRVASVHSAINSAIEAIARIPHLQTLMLRLPSLDPIVNLAPLHELSQLQSLGLTTSAQGCVPLSVAQANDIRAISNLTRLNTLLRSCDLRSLLRAPHQLQWQTMRVAGPLDPQHAALLVSLPLTDLTVNSCEDVTFLSSLPNLRSLKLVTFASSLPLLSPGEMVQGVGPCKQLTSLSISNSKLASAHITALLSCMPAVSMLELESMPLLESLSFLSSEPLHRSLASLSLYACRHKYLCTAELRQLYPLQQLTHLNIDLCFSDPLNSFTKTEFKLPSARLPKLATCILEGEEFLAEEEE